MLKIMNRYINETDICRQQMIDYYFKTGEFSTEQDVDEIEKCGNDNCNTDTTKSFDITEDCRNVCDVLNQCIIRWEWKN